MRKVVSVSASCLCFLVTAAVADDDIPTEIITDDPVVTEGTGPDTGPPDPPEPPEPVTHTPDGRLIDDGSHVEPLPSETKVPKPEIFNDVSRKIQEKHNAGKVGN